MVLTRSKSKRRRPAPKEPTAETTAEEEGITAPPSAKRSRRSSSEPQEKQDEKPTAASEEEQTAQFDAKPFILGCFVVKAGVQCATKWWDRLAGCRKYQEDADIVAAAMECGLPVTKLTSDNKLLHDADAALKLFCQAKNRQQVQELWDVVGANVKLTPAVALRAFDRGVTWSKVPKQVTQHKDNLKEALTKGYLRWKRLPIRLKADVELALCCLAALENMNSYRRRKEGTRFKDVLSCVTDKQQLWAGWACQHPGEPPMASWRDARFIPWNEAPASILSNKDLMLQAVSKAAFVTQHVAPSLFLQGDFVKPLLEANILALSYLPQDVFEMLMRGDDGGSVDGSVMMEWIVKYMAAAKLQSQHADRLRKKIPKHHWKDRGFVDQWLSVGGRLHVDMGNKDELGDDEAFLLKYAQSIYEQHKTKRNWQYCFPRNFVSLRLRSDLQFVKRLLEYVDAQSVLHMVGNSCLRNDTAFLTLLCARNSPKDGYRLHFVTKRWSFRNTLQGQLHAYDGFFQGILCGTTTGSGSPLVLLNHGSDADIKKTIASFLDFPKGEQLTWLFKATENLGIGASGPLPNPAPANDNNLPIQTCANSPHSFVFALIVEQMPTG